MRNPTRLGDRRRGRRVWSACVKMSATKIVECGILLVICFSCRDSRVFTWKRTCFKMVSYTVSVPVIRCSFTSMTLTSKYSMRRISWSSVTVWSEWSAICRWYLIDYLSYYFTTWLPGSFVKPRVLSSSFDCYFLSFAKITIVLWEVTFMFVNSFAQKCWYKSQRRLACSYLNQKFYFKTCLSKGCVH